MQSDELKKFTDRIDKGLKKQFNHLDDEKRALARTVKLVEEVGELCEEILLHNNLQRRKKLDKRDKGNISGEFTDVLITTLLLAKLMKVDIDKALLVKMKEIDKRHES